MFTVAMIAIMITMLMALIRAFLGPSISVSYTHLTLPTIYSV